MVKNLLPMQKHCSVPGLGRFPGVGNATHSSILAWRMPWTEAAVHRISKSWKQLSD